MITQCTATELQFQQQCSIYDSIHVRMHVQMCIHMKRTNGTLVCMFPHRPQWVMGDTIKELSYSSSGGHLTLINTSSFFSFNGFSLFVLAFASFKYFFRTVKE